MTVVGTWATENGVALGRVTIAVAVAVVVRVCRVGAAVTDDVRYYVSSAASSAAYMLKAVRGHWEIENGLHRVLDVAFREDANRTRSGRAGENLAWVRRVALSLLNQVPGGDAVQTKRLKAGWDEDFLLDILGKIKAP